MLKQIGVDVSRIGDLLKESLLWALGWIYLGSVLLFSFVTLLKIRRLRNVVTCHEPGSSLGKAYFLISNISMLGVDVNIGNKPGETFTFRGKPHIDYPFLVLMFIAPFPLAIGFHIMILIVLRGPLFSLAWHMPLIGILFYLSDWAMKYLATHILINHYSTGKVFKTFRTGIIKYK